MTKDLALLIGGQGPLRPDRRADGDRGYSGMDSIGTAADGSEIRTAGMPR